MKKFTNQIEEVLEEIKSAMSTLRDMSMWLPDAIDSAVNKTRHKGTLDRVDIDDMTKERAEEQKRAEEINILKSQTKELQKQTKYIFWGVLGTIILSAIGIIVNLILR
ncbi:hypothetical protein IID20_01560 [Patescibacteria group bacterium]|nr:hypothetical protein [Patescibacteria group bacterium]